MTIITLAMFLVGFSVAGSSGGVKKIEPEQFMVYSTNTTPYYGGPENLYANTSGSGVSFYSMVKLPVGQVVKKLTVYYSGYTGTNGPYAGCTLSRQKMGDDAEYVVGIYSATDSSGIEALEETMVNSFTKKIKSGYKYWVSCYSANWNSFIYGVKIAYK